MRFSFIVGVSSPLSSVKSTGSIRNLRIDSACETARLACLIAESTSAVRSGSSARSPTEASASLPLRCFQPVNASGSMVINAPMNGLASPTAIAWLISGWERSWSSSTAGATFLPPAVTMISFLRPVIVKNPSSSTAPRSPVLNQPSTTASAVACSLFQ